jgi:hypothetical protein
MLEDDSKLGKDETYDALKNVLKAKLLDEFPKQAREAREQLQALKTTPEEDIALDHQISDIQEVSLIEKKDRIKSLIHRIRQNKVETRPVLKPLKIDRSGFKEGMTNLEVKKDAKTPSFNSSGVNLSLRELDISTPDPVKINACYKKKQTLNDNTCKLIEHLTKKALRSGRNYDVIDLTLKESYLNYQAKDQF